MVGDILWVGLSLADLSRKLAEVLTAIRNLF